jgi:general secretion pathway protein D
VRISTSFLILLAIFSFLYPWQSCGNTFAAETQSGRLLNESSREISIDFDNVDIMLFIKYMSELTGKNFVVDKAVKGNVTIISPRKISEAEAYRVFESVLEVHGFTTVPSGPVIKIVPAAMARTQNIDTLRTGSKEIPEDKVVTQLIPLKYTSPEEIKKALVPLLAKTSVMIAHTHSGMLIVTDTLSNIQRLLSIIEALDVPYPRERIDVIPLKNGSVTVAANIINAIFQKTATGKETAAGWQDISCIVPYERINALVVMASDADLNRIHNLVTLLDSEKEKGNGNIHVFYLQNANAKDLAKVLGDLPQNQVSGGGKGNTTNDSKDVRIMADEETNSLIISASPAEYGTLEGVIKKLDIPRRMVYLEALIMEVNTSKDFSVGVQWVSSDGKVFSGFSGSASSPYGNITNLTADTPSLPAGGTLGVFNEGIRIGGLTFPDLAAVINAYKNDSDINIISTPQVLTTDNKKAEISVGENVPYITSKNTTTGTQQDYTNYEYRDVSTKLTIVPHINQTGALRLNIKTEVIKLKDSSSSSISLTPTTLKRTADTTVIVRDNQTVVIGGIIGHDETESDYKVPLLGDIPVLGWLFKTHSTNATKTNMFIFVTPHIIKNPADISHVTRNKEKESGKTFSEIRDSLVKPEDRTRSLKISERGYDEMQNNNLTEAKKYFMESLQVDPENPYALINLAVIYEKEGQSEKAVAAYRKVVLSGTGRLASGSSDPKKVGESLTGIAKEGLIRLHADIPASPGDRPVENDHNKRANPNK